MIAKSDRIIIALAIVCHFCCPPSLSAKEKKLLAVSAEMKQAATNFLKTLDNEQRDKTTFRFEGSERTDWHFIPKDRVGVSFKEMNLEQRRAARLLMRSVLSEKGYLKAVTVMSLERVLRLLEADRENVNKIRDPEKYWFAVFGDPTNQKPWGWRVEGHHLSLNFTAINGEVVGTAPIFLGSNPAEVRVGPRLGLRALGNEEDQARALMAAFTPEQQEQVIISDKVPRDVLTVPGKSLDIGEPAGISANEMTDQQRSLLQAMTTSFVHHLRPALAEKEIREMEAADIGKIHFAWAGSLNPEENHYFRLHGPTFILEYDNAQGNHAHLVWHSRENDFGAKILHRHYQTSPHHQGAELDNPPGAMSAPVTQSSVLIDPDWLAAQLDQNNVRVIEVGMREHYDVGHISQAAFVDWINDITDPMMLERYNVLPRNQMEKLLCRLGIGPDTVVVLYDRLGSRLATRMFWSLRYYGHQQVKILDGGAQAWHKSGKPIVTEMPEIDSTVYRIEKSNEAMKADRGFIKSRLAQPQLALIDGRPTGQFTGELPGKVYHTGKEHARRGHIPQAVNIPWNENLQADGRFKSVTELRKIYTKQGLTSDSTIVTYCNEGLHAAHPWFVLTELLGYKNVCLYDDSLAEWANLPDEPLEVIRRK